MFSCEFYKIFKNPFYVLPAAASKNCYSEELHEILRKTWYSYFIQDAALYAANLPKNNTVVENFTEIYWKFKGQLFFY